jgi:UDP-glucose 4-epimerase
MRDYISADDAAAIMVDSLRTSDVTMPAVTKIVASENPTTIAEIVSIFKRISRRAPRIITSTNRLTAIYTRRMQFRSGVPPQRRPSQQTSLLTGIAQIMEAERSAYVCGLSDPW